MIVKLNRIIVLIAAIIAEAHPFSLSAQGTADGSDPYEADSEVGAHSGSSQYVVNHTEMEICEGDSVAWGELWAKEEGEYSYTDSLNKKINTLALSVRPKPIIDPEYQVNMCLGDMARANLEGSDNYTYKWSPSLYLSADDVKNPMISIKHDTTYMVSVSDGFCEETVIVSVFVDSGPKIGDIDYDVHTEMVSLNVEGGVPPYMYTWDGSLWQMGSAYHSQYSRLPNAVKVKDAYGCEASAHLMLDIPLEISVFFSPNGDGINDVLEIGQLSHFEHYRVRIFDHKGVLLVEYKDQYTGWDGTYNGEKLPAGDYWYQIDIEDVDKMYLGHVTILR